MPIAIRRVFVLRFRLGESDNALAQGRLYSVVIEVHLCIRVCPSSLIVKSDCAWLGREVAQSGSQKCPEMGASPLIQRLKNGFNQRTWRIPRNVLGCALYGKR